MSEFVDMWNLAASTPEYQRLTEASKLEVRRKMFEAGRREGMFSREEEGNVMDKLALFGEEKGLEEPGILSSFFNPFELGQILLTGGLGGGHLVRGVHAGARALGSVFRGVRAGPRALGSVARGVEEKLLRPELTGVKELAARGAETSKREAAEAMKEAAAAWRAQNAEILRKLDAERETFATARAAAEAGQPVFGQKLLPPARELMPEVFRLRPTGGRATPPPTGRVIEQGPRRVPPSIMPPRGEGYPARITERITRPIREELPKEMGRQVVLQGKKVVPERPSSSPFLRLAEEERVAQALQQRKTALQAVYDRLPEAHGQVRRVAMDMIEGKPIAKADLKRAQAIELQVKEYLTPKTAGAAAGKKTQKAAPPQAVKAATPQPKEFDPSVPGEMLPNTEFRKMVDETSPGGLF